ncbi:hypothetical protein HYU18_00295 [Candidatus Woesearchaeota archaeon]|nr:hypothetical protein [Candidatus Woesearchaeota archaeon]
MKRSRQPSANSIAQTIKVLSLVLMVIAYAIAAVGFRWLADNGVIEKSPPMAALEEGSDTLVEFGPETDIVVNLQAAQSFFETSLVQDNGHVNLYLPRDGKSKAQWDNTTNSEAMSYYLLWSAIDGNKETFDHVLNFIEYRMLHPEGFMMWHLDENDAPVSDGRNIASDADLRAIRALLIAEQKWGGKKYSGLIGSLADGLEKVAITNDTMLAPYGGMSGNSTWTSEEVWISYSDFVALQALADRRGSPWKDVYANMKNASLGAQIHNGLYNSQLTDKRAYGNGIDNGGYSINSLWIMVRNAESNDQDLKKSARKSLDFYKQRFAKDGKLYASYQSNGEPTGNAESPWVYALVARAAVNLEDWDFSHTLKDKLLEYQDFNASSPFYGAFPEGRKPDLRVGQFTMQETILTLQGFMRNKHEYELYLALNANSTALGGG